MRWILLLLVGLLSACAGGTESCRLEMVAAVPVRQQGSVPVVEVRINGRPATLVLDTGSDSTVLNRAAARRLGLVEGAGRQVGGAAGVTTVATSRVGTLAIGGAEQRDLRVLLADAPRPPLDGVLGLDVLNAYELDLDVPGGRATLYRFRPCPTALPGWTEPTVRLPTQMQAGSGHLFVPVRVDGEELRGMLDSGASVSTLSVQAAEDVRVNQRRLQALPGFRSQALNPGGLVVRQRRFERMQVGTDVVEGPVLSIGDLPPFAGDMLVGADYLATRRVWFSFLLGHVFVMGTPPS